MYCQSPLISWVLHTQYIAQTLAKMRRDEALVTVCCMLLLHVEVKLSSAAETYIVAACACCETVYAVVAAILAE